MKNMGLNETFSNFGKAWNQFVEVLLDSLSFILIPILEFFTGIMRRFR